MNESQWKMKYLTYTLIYTYIGLCLGFGWMQIPGFKFSLHCVKCGIFSDTFDVRLVIRYTENQTVILVHVMNDTTTKHFQMNAKTCTKPLMNKQPASNGITKELKSFNMYRIRRINVFITVNYSSETALSTYPIHTHTQTHPKY